MPLTVYSVTPIERGRHLDLQNTIYVFVEFTYVTSMTVFHTLIL
jgi:hypothetical protein